MGHNCTGHDYTIESQVEFLVEEYDGKGWIIGHDDHGYDRSVIISDARYGGMGQGMGSVYDPGLGYASKDVWHHFVAVFRQVM